MTGTELTSADTGDTGGHEPGTPAGNGRGEVLLYAPLDGVDLVVRAGQQALIGALAFVFLDWRPWVGDAAQAARLDKADQIASAAGGRLRLSERETHQQRRERRMRRSWQIAAAVAVALLVASVAGFQPMPWLGYGGLAASGLFLAGLFTKSSTAAIWCYRLCLWPIPVLLPFGITAWRWWPAAVVFVLVTAVCWWRGGNVGPPTPKGGAAGLRRRDWQTLWSTAETELAARGKVLERANTARPISADGHELGAGFSARCTDAIVPEDVRALERKLGFPAGASAWIPDPAAAGAGELRLVWSDPLPPAPMPRREPMSLSYTRPFPVARRDGGRTTELSLNRTRVLLAGNSGSGKSQALQGILDGVCDMPDVGWSAIDRQEGPTFKAYRQQWNCAGVHFTREDALAEIQRLRALCIERNRRLDEGMDADLDGEIDQWWIVDETGETPDRRGHVLFIDELSSLTTEARIAHELVLLLEVCRKASVSVVMATPDLDKDRVPRAVLDQVNTSVGFACPFSDAVQMFGKGSTQSGWEPYRLTPATDDEPNDAGKAYIRGGTYNAPEVHRFGAMGKDEIVGRNRARRLWRERHLGETRGTSPTSATGGPDVVDAVEVPYELAAIERALGDADRVTSEEAARVAGMSAQSLARAVKAYGLVPAKWRAGAATERGYTREALVTALDGLS